MSDAETVRPAAVRIQVLGSITAHRGDDRLRLTPVHSQVIASLVAAGPDGITTDEAADAFWGEDQPTNPAASVRMRLSRLRRLLGSDVVSHSELRTRLLLPLETVDVWHLHALAGSAPLGDDPNAILAVLEGVPFPGHEDTDAIAVTLGRIHASRLTLARRLREERPDLIDPRVALAIAEHSGAHNLEETLTRWPTTPSRPSHLAIPDPAVRLADATGRRPARPSRRPTDSTGRPLAADLARQFSSPLLGRDDELSSAETGLDDQRATLVLGRGGSGKSRLLAEIAGRRADRRSILYVCALRNAHTAYGPFVAALPEFADRIEPDATPSPGTDDDLTRRARSWRELWHLLNARSGDASTLLIVDDAQWLDSSSAQLLEFLVRSADAYDLEVIVAARTEPSGPLWNELGSTLARTMTAVELPPLDVATLIELVGRIHPSSPPLLRRDFAAELVTLTGGLPAIARLVIENADPSTLQHRRLGSKTRALDHYLDHLNDDALTVGSAASIIDGPFGVDDLAHFTDLTEARILDAIDELLAQRLVRDDVPGRVCFVHVLMKDAFLARMSDARRQRLHQIAAERTDDVHDLAAHLSRAVSLVPAERALEALLASARAHAAAGAHREAVNDFRRTTTLPHFEFGSEDLTLWATSLDRSGGDGHPLRRRAFERAKDDGDWSAALRAALSGLPEGEVHNGDGARLDLLAAVEPETLTRRERFVHAAEVGRQSELLGRKLSARRALDRAERLVETPTEDARRASDRALLHGHRYGLNGAGPAWTGQQWWMARCFGPGPSIDLDTLPPDVRDVPLAQAAMLLFRLDRAESADEITAIRDEMHTFSYDCLEGSSAREVIQMLAPHLDHADGSLIHQARAMLEPHAESWLVVGAGVLNRGPIDLALGDLHHGAERKRFWLQALEQADATGSPTWRVWVRLELARRGLGDDLEREARRIAVGTEIDGELELA